MSYKGEIILVCTATVHREPIAKGDIIRNCGTGYLGTVVELPYVRSPIKFLRHRRSGSCY